LELEGARIFFPEERWSEFNPQLRAHWLEHATPARQLTATVA
jgi:hypothetical protein